MLEAQDSLLPQLKALANPDRLRLLQLLAQPERFTSNLVDPRSVGVCVNDLAKAADLPQSTASHHLGILQKAGLLIATEHGPWRYIRVDRQALHQLSALLEGLAP